MTWWLDGEGTGTVMGHGSQITYKITAQGAHTVAVVGVDSAGLVARDSITVNVGPPSGNPSVVITSPNEGTQHTFSVHLTATATSPVDGPMPGSAIHWSNDLDPAWQPTGDDVTFTVPNSCAFRQTRFTATATDSATHTGTDTILLYTGTIC